ncbi:MAG: helix-turn-helix domain-containing protein [Oscillospiraceae bacterium]|nr:helix-turn-helix domain-containing protein [Oscillospiraceae bacterium]
MPRLKQRLDKDIDLRVLLNKYKLINKIQAEKVAAQFGVSKRSVYTWVNHPGRVSYDVLMLLCHYYGVPIAELRETIKY